jgi:hypothetical protein
MPFLVICTKETEYFSTRCWYPSKKFLKDNDETILYKSLMNTLIRIKDSVVKGMNTTARLSVTYEMWNINSIRGNRGILLSMCGKFIHVMVNWSSFCCYSLVERLFDLYLVFNATFNNISAISWRQVLVVEEAGIPGENHRPWESNW